jgi:hypothetical protein
VPPYPPLPPQTNTTWSPTPHPGFTPQTSATGSHVGISTSRSWPSWPWPCFSRWRSARKNQLYTGLRGKPWVGYCGRSFRSLSGPAVLQELFQLFSPSQVQLSLYIFSSWPHLVGSSCPLKNEQCTSKYTSAAALVMHVHFSSSSRHACALHQQLVAI